MADHLIVIGQGSILADCSMQEFMADHAQSYVRVKASDVGVAAQVLASSGLEVGRHHGSTGPELHVQGLDAAAVGELLGRHGLAAARADSGELVARGRLHDPHRRQRGVPRPRPDHRRWSAMSTLSSAARVPPGPASRPRCARSGSSSPRCGRRGGRSPRWCHRCRRARPLICGLNADWLASDRKRTRHPDPSSPGG